jgi:tetratricopeptide (TPR) repeat protein
MKPLVLLIILSVALPALGEVVYLNDGTSLEGELRRTSDGWVVTDPAGKSTVVAAGQVRSIQVKKSDGSPQGADDRLASLRRAAANLNDIKRILIDYKSFIAQNPNTPAAKIAEQEMAQWQDRLDKGLVKAGTRWVTQEELAGMQAQALRSAGTIRSLIEAGQLQEAGKQLDQALGVAPQNAALLFLKGELLFRSDQLVPARNAFQSAEAQQPEHGPTHNNIAVVLWRTRAQMPALLEYDKAMLAAPANERILDNVAEALHVLPKEHQNNALTKKVVGHFKDQNIVLEKRMAQRGLYHWGTAWVTEAEFNKLDAEEKAAQDKVDALKKSAFELQTRIAKIDRDINDEQNLMTAILAQCAQVDPISGRQIMFPPPPRYYDLQRDVMLLKNERVQRVRDLQVLPRQIAEAEKAKPAKKYSGSQKLFDVDETPGLPHPAETPGTTEVRPPSPAAPATRPAVAPLPVHKGGADFAPEAPANHPARQSPKD